MGQPYVDQDRYRWVNDDGTVETATFAEALNTALGTVTTIEYDKNFRLRFGLKNTGAKNADETFNLQYNIDGAGWNSASGITNHVRITASGEESDNEPIVIPRLGMGGTYDEGYFESSNGQIPFVFDLGEESENEFCFQFRSADFSGTETCALRFGIYPTTAIDAYTNEVSHTMPTPPSPTLNQSHFRIRSGDDYDLGVDNGWAAAEDTNATIGRGIIFRILFKLTETNGISKAAQYKLQVNRESTGWVEIYEWNRDVFISPVSLTLSSRYADGDAITTELLTNDGGTWTNGEAVEAVTLDNLTDLITLNDQETEVEWALMIQSTHINTSDAVVENIAGDELEFRMVESDGTVFNGSYVNPTITVADTAGYVGGCYVESPERIGPFKDSNGNLYFVSEAGAAGDADMIHVWKSGDGGDTWRIKTDANAPTSSSAEGECVSVYHYGQTLHILAQGGSREVEYSQYHMSDHATKADLWDNSTTPIVSESVHDPGASQASDQGCGIIIRPNDGYAIAVYRDFSSPYEQVMYRIRPGLTDAQSWGSAVEVDATASTSFIFSGIVLGEDSKIHIFYKDVTASPPVLYHRSLDKLDALGTRHEVEADPTGHVDGWATSPAIYWDNAGTEEVMIVVHDDSDDYLYSVVISDDGSADARKAASDNTVREHVAGGHQPTVDLVVDPATKIAYMLYADLTTADLYRDEADNDGGWGTDVEQKDGAYIDFVRGNIFTHSAGNGGDKVYGFFYANSPGIEAFEGYTGDIWYGEYVITAGAARRIFRTHL